MKARRTAISARRSGVMSAALLVAILLARPLAAQEAQRAPAQNGDGMDSHLFRPAVDSKGFFSVNGTDILGHNDISFGLILDYGKNLLRTNPKREDVPGYEGPGVDSLVDDSFQGTFHFNYGLFNRLVVGLSVPVILMAGGEANDIGQTGNTYDTQKLDAEKISTLALHAKLRLTRVERGPGLAVIFQGGFPVADAPRDLGADPGAWYWPQLALQNDFGRTRRLKLGLNVGYRGHTGENPQFGKDSRGLNQLAEGELQYGNLVTFGAGVSYRVLDSMDLVLETYGTQLLASNTANDHKRSQEVLGGIKLFVERNSYLMMAGGGRLPIDKDFAVSRGFQAADVRLVLGFVFEPSIGDRDGDGIKDDQDQCPDEPEDKDGFEDEDGCPDPDNDKDGILDVDDACPNVPEDFDGDADEDGCPGGTDLDRDGDGIPDSRDKCPTIPEDKDGFEDEDGCPEYDNDKDGIPDVQDKCPNDPETYNGFEDEDGCPDKGRVIIAGSDIVILDKVQFETNSARILPESDPILDAVAAALKGHPEFAVIEVAGHADERGSDEHNLRLTRARAAAVADALARRGISRQRLVSQGYGEYCPLETESTPAAWDKNRRVEFKIVKTDEGVTDVERGCERATGRGVSPPPAP
jgi:OmpA-OmpF porin, OOP family